MATIESGLEVNTDSHAKAPELHIPDVPKEAVSNLSQERSSYPVANHSLLPQPPEGRNRRPRICGLSPLLYGCLVALVTAIIVGAAVGGGMSAALNDNHKAAPQQSINSTTTLTTTIFASATTVAATTASVATTTGGLLVSYAAPTPSSIASVALDCPSLDGQTHQTLTSQTFQMSCTTSYQGGDILAIAAYSAFDCIEACASINRYQNDNACTRIQFTAYMASALKSQDGNCWLKNGTSTTKPVLDGDFSASLLQPVS